VIQAVVDVLKMYARPGSIYVHLFLLGVGAALAFSKRTQRLARWYFLTIFLATWILTTPACAERLVGWRADGSRPLASASEAQGARVVVVLGAGSQTLRARGLNVSAVTWTTNFRILEGARLYRLLDRPTIMVSGGVTSREAGARSEAEAMRAAILQLGVPADRVVMESESQDTRAEASMIRRMLADRAADPIVLVTSPTHMERSLAVFRAAGLNPIPSPAAYKSEGSLETRRWLPSDVGSILLDAVVYDTAATWYYRARGWMPR
jgi:uncharacterized SAM-binding protein YcdF (DUF218 family)